MHLGDFFWLPKREEIRLDFLPNPLNRDEGMFGHPVVIVNIKKTTCLVSHRSVTSVKKRTDRIQQGIINGQDRIATRVCIKRRGYSSSTTCPRTGISEAMAEASKKLTW